MPTKMPSEKASASEIAPTAIKTIAVIVPPRFFPMPVPNGSSSAPAAESSRTPPRIESGHRLQDRHPSFDVPAAAQRRSRWSFASLFSSHLQCCGQRFHLGCRLLCQAKLFFGHVAGVLVTPVTPLCLRRWRCLLLRAAGACAATVLTSAQPAGDELSPVRPLRFRRVGSQPLTGLGQFGGQRCRRVRRRPGIAVSVGDALPAFDRIP